MDRRAIKNITSYVGRSLPAYFPGKKREKKNDQVQKVQRKKNPKKSCTSFAAAKREASSLLTAASFGVDFLLAPLLLDLPDGQNASIHVRNYKSKSFELRLLNRKHLQIALG